MSATKAEIWQHLSAGLNHYHLPAPSTVAVYAETLITALTFAELDEASQWATWLHFEESADHNDSGLWFHGELFGWHWSVRSYIPAPAEAGAS